MEVMSQETIKERLRSKSKTDPKEFNMAGPHRCREFIQQKGKDLARGGYH